MTTDAAAQTPAEWPADDPRLACVLDIVAKETGVARDRLTPDASITDLDIASLDMVQAIFAIETHFGVEIPVIADRHGADQGGGEFATVGDFTRQVLAAIGREQPA